MMITILTTIGIILMAEVVLLMIMEIMFTMLIKNSSDIDNNIYADRTST